MRAVPLKKLQETRRRQAYQTQKKLTARKLHILLLNLTAVELGHGSSTVQRYVQMLQTLPLLLVCPRTFSKLDVCPPANWQERFTQSLSHIRIHITHFCSGFYCGAITTFFGGEEERSGRRGKRGRRYLCDCLVRFDWLVFVGFRMFGLFTWGKGGGRGPIVGSHVPPTDTKNLTQYDSVFC